VGKRVSILHAANFHDVMRIQLRILHLSRSKTKTISRDVLIRSEVVKEIILGRACSVPLYCYSKYHNGKSRTTFLEWIQVDLSACCSHSILVGAIIVL
jgi:hypothetical protein